MQERNAVDSTINRLEKLICQNRRDRKLRQLALATVKLAGVRPVTDSEVGYDDEGNRGVRVWFDDGSERFFRENQRDDPADTGDSEADR